MQRAAQPDHLPLNVERAGAHVQVVPFQRANFSPAHPGGQLQQGKLVEVVFLCLDQKSLHLLMGQHLHLPRLLWRQLTADGRVKWDELLVHRLFQRRSAGGVAGAHHTVGEPRTVILLPEQTPALFQLGVKLLQVALLQFVQRDRADTGDDVLVDSVLITVLGRGPQRGLGPGLVPQVDPLPEGHVRPRLARDDTAGGFQRLQLFKALRFGL